MLDPAEGLPLQAPELMHQVFEGKAFIGFDLPERWRVSPADIERPDGVRRFHRGGMLPSMAPHIHRGRPGIVAPALLDVMLVRIAEQGFKLLAGVGKIDSVPRAVHGRSSDR